MRTPLPRAVRPAFALGLALALVPAPVIAQNGEDGWDVEQSLGPSRTLAFTTDQGTWMNLDVSPDGGTLVFDLLGDLYAMPTTGGEATRLTSGGAFDFQPRYSPDGSSIAFTSDRDGAQNIWLMDPDGGNLRQVTEEGSREVNSPSWSPDGEDIFVRKHFVDQRSLGAGEVWMYHRSGGAGLQVTDRTSWQKDQGEPAVDPAGEWVYYSQDVTSGEQFEYNKDPYAGIYAILRRHLVTGETEYVTGGPGGAITPRLSPDGRLLSFIRRDRLDTELWLRDLDTGEEWSIWDGLERDMQEIWAIHGVYTQYDWLPDGSGLVIWAQGGFWRVAADGSGAEQVPFSADVEQTVHEGLRFAVDPAPDTWRARMLRNVTSRRDGGLVAYDALGRIYTAAPGQDGRPLTAGDYDTPTYELDPAFSPDGRRIAFATWSDAEAGRIRVVNANGRGMRTVVSRNGHYVEPAWSPDGEWLVYRSVGGDGIRGDVYGEHTGIYLVPADGSAEPRKVRDGGADPMFDHTGERVYVVTGGRLVSTDRSGGDEVVHLESEDATQVVPSPDGEWVAFAERHHAWVMPFPRAGRTVQIGPDASYPVARISRDAGLYLHWSGEPGAWRVHWSLGPDYFSRDLAETFAWLEGGAAGEEPADPEAEGEGISFTMSSDRPDGAIALTGARVITMAGTGWSPPGGWQPEAGSHQAETSSDVPTVIEDGVIVIEGNRITAVGAAGSVAVPAGAETFDVSGKTIIPGLVDAHAHVGGENSGILAQASWPLLANLAYGVTTAHDPSNGTETVFSNIELLRAGEKLGPRLASTGTILYGAEGGGSIRSIVDDYDDALAHLRRMKAVGAFSVKSYNQRRRDARQMIIRAARELEMQVHPEGGALLYGNMTMVHDGHTGVEHALSVPVVYDDVQRLFAASSTGYTPTLLVAYGGIWGENWFFQHYNVWENERLLTYTPRGQVDARSRRRMLVADDDFNHIRVAEGARAISEAGGLVNLGAHGQLQGLGVHWELWSFVQGGMTPLEALAVGTINGARYIAMDQHIGTLEPGKLADLVVLDANPLDDITHSDDISMVMLNGRLYDAATLDELAPRERERLPLPWERERTGLR